MLQKVQLLMGTDMTQEQTTYSSDIQDCALRLLDTANDLSKIVQVHIPPPYLLYLFH